jgi:excisionase family DNA binding protein
VDEEAFPLTVMVPAEHMRRLAALAKPPDAPPRLSPEPWMTVKGAAEYLACKPRRIHDLVSEGRLRQAKDGRRSLFRVEWLDAVLEGAGDMDDLSEGHASCR